MDTKLNNLYAVCPRSLDPFDIFYTVYNENAKRYDTTPKGKEVFFLMNIAPLS